MAGGDIVLWTLQYTSRVVTCIDRSGPNGREYAVLYAGILPLASYAVRTTSDADAWAERIRRAWESLGWTRASE